jgi:hypothetical protein
MLKDESFDILEIINSKLLEFKEAGKTMSRIYLGEDEFGKLVKAANYMYFNIGQKKEGDLVCKNIQVLGLEGYIVNRKHHMHIC